MKNPLSPWQTSKLTSDLRRRFEELRDTIQQHLRGSEDGGARMLADRVRDIGEESVTDMLTGVELAEGYRELEELREVESALLRLQKGTYGVCLSCNTPIPYDRLAAQPTAKRCLRCQTTRETTHAGPGGRTAGGT